MNKLRDAENQFSVSALLKQIVTLLAMAALALAGATAEAQISGFGGNGAGWTLNTNPNYGSGGGAPPSVSSDVLNIINGYYGDNSAFYDTPQDISSFTVSYVWQNTTGPGVGINPADGLTFTLQNQGPTALGGGGGALGYEGITPASGVAFNLYSFGHVVVLGYAPVSTGNGSGSYQSTGAVNFDSTDPISVQITYSGNLLSVAVKDLTTSASYNTSFSVNVPGDAGGNTAYVGFTGGSGGGASDQTVSNFQFIPEPSSFLLVALGGVPLVALLRRKRG
ncbi:MAG: lectin-like domain-containing protein [Verrucomicrobiia bacterium]